MTACYYNFEEVVLELSRVAIGGIMALSLHSSIIIITITSSASLLFKV
jgi:hypothetical protein